MIIHIIVKGTAIQKNIDDMVTNKDNLCAVI